MPPCGVEWCLFAATVDHQSRGNRTAKPETATHVAATQVCGTAQEMVPVVVSAAPAAVVAAPQVRPVMA